MSDTIQRGLGIEEVIGDKRDDIIALAYKHGASNVRVFGSVARGEATEDSDIDFLVDWDYERISSWGGAGLYIELEDLLGHKVDIGTESQLRPRIRERVLKECVRL
jgi:predicted nucleotidyltransferase